ncbi:MAG: hypothetical protein ACLGH0_12505 [Thermoanaerobaculia bacterium]
MRHPRKTVLVCLLVLFSATTTHAFFEDLCIPRQGPNGTVSWCLTPTCPNPPQPNRACPEQVAQFVNVMPGRSMIHADSTYFIALALGYRADVAYWIAAYNEVTDYAQYVPIDQCGYQAANLNSIQNQKTLQTKPNSGRDYITAYFNGFQRTNLNTDGPLDHYVVFFSPSGQGTDVHGAGGASALYPLYYPRPGYPEHIDDTYQKTLANFRQWAMNRATTPGLLCTVGLLDSSGTRCLTGAMITGSVPGIMPQQVTQTPAVPGIPISVATGPKVLNVDASNNATPYTELQSWLDDPKRTTGKLWKSPKPGSVPIQIARIGIYLHTLQDTSSHSTYCGDDPPSPPGGGDYGTYMYMADGNVNLSFGNSCATGPHLAGHLQETGTGDASLPLRVYVALNNTVDELIVFGNEVAKHQDGWIANLELLPPNLKEKNAQGQNATDLKSTLVGTIVQGQAYSGAEVYKSGVVTLPLQQTNSEDRLHRMNAALAKYGDEVRARSANPAAFAKFEHMPGNSADPRDKSVCWK